MFCFIVYELSLGNTYLVKMYNRSSTANYALYKISLHFFDVLGVTVQSATLTVCSDFIVFDQRLGKTT